MSSSQKCFFSLVARYAEEEGGVTFHHFGAREPKKGRPLEQSTRQVGRHTWECSETAVTDVRGDGAGNVPRLIVLT